MPFGKGLKRLTKRVKGELVFLFPPRNPLQPSTSLPNATGPSNSPAPTAGSPTLHSRPDLSATSLQTTTHPDPSSTTNSPSTLLVTNATPSTIVQINASAQQVPAQSTLSPAPVSTSSPAAPPASPSPGTNRWAGLKGFLGVLHGGAGAFGPLKVVMDELVECIEIYEVCVLVLLHVFTLAYSTIAGGAWSRGI
jgi:hypothetical protein